MLLMVMMQAGGRAESSRTASRWCPLNAIADCVVGERLQQQASEREFSTGFRDLFGLFGWLPMRSVDAIAELKRLAFRCGVWQIACRRRLLIDREQWYGQ